MICLTVLNQSSRQLTDWNFTNWRRAWAFIESLSADAGTTYWRIAVDGLVARDELEEGMPHVMWNALAEDPDALKLWCGMTIGDAVERYPLEPPP